MEPDRAELRRKVKFYVRDTKELFAWVFPTSVEAVAMTNVYPYRSDITKVLCHRLYRDLQTARSIDKHRMRSEVLRELFASECWLYRSQCKIALQMEEIGR